MFIFRIYKINSRGHIAFREELAIDVSEGDAKARAQAAAVDCIIELWRGSNLLVTFRPETDL